MIDDPVAELASAYQQFCLEAGEQLKHYQLNFSWLSVGALDMFTFFLRGKEVLSKSELAMLNGAAAYLGSLVHDCWGMFADDLKVKVSLKGQSSEGNIIIEARGGTFLGKEQAFTVSLTETLKQILFAPPDPFPVFEKVTRPLPPQHNLFSLLGIGLFTGLCPFGSGPWKDHAAQMFAPYIVPAEQFLAISTANHYKLLFPAEELGHQPELYLANLILPPAMYEEPFPACRPAIALTDYLKENQITPERMETLALNLASLPDELIFSAGFALAVALTKERPSTELCAVAEAKVHYAPYLRPAIMAARRNLDLNYDWLQNLADNEPEKAKNLLSIERELGIIPLFWIPPQHLDNADLLPFFEAAGWDNLEAAQTVLTKLLEQKKLPPEMVLQKIYLDLAAGDAELAEKELAHFVNDIGSDDFSDRYLIWELQGLIALQSNDLDRATQAYANAFQEKPEDLVRLTSIGNNYAWYLMLQQQYEEALGIIDQVLHRNFNSVTCRLNKAAVLAALENEEESAAELKDLSTYAHMDRRVFENILRGKPRAAKPEEKE